MSFVGMAMYHYPNIMVMDWLRIWLPYRFGSVLSFYMYVHMLLAVDVYGGCTLCIHALFSGLLHHPACVSTHKDAFGRSLRDGLASQITFDLPTYCTIPMGAALPSM